MEYYEEEERGRKIAAGGSLTESLTEERGRKIAAAEIEASKLLEHEVIYQGFTSYFSGAD